MSVDQELIDSYRAIVRKDMELPDSPNKMLLLNNRLCLANDIPELVAVWHEETGIPENEKLIKGSGSLRILITGSRRRQTAKDLQQIMSALIEVIQMYGWKGKVTVVHGACPRGIDALVRNLAQIHNFSLEAHPADWGKYGRSAGPIRNQEMVDSGIDVCLAFPDSGSSPGTRGTIRMAKKRGIPTYVYLPEGKEE